MLDAWGQTAPVLFGLALSNGQINFPVFKLGSAFFNLVCLALEHMSKYMQNHSFIKPFEKSRVLSPTGDSLPGTISPLKGESELKYPDRRQ